MRQWHERLPAGLTVRVVVQQPGQDSPRQLAGIPVIVDPGRRLATAVALPPSRDGGPGVGYAVVDAASTTRFATLDPAWDGNGFDITTIVGATR